jgi:hypothetical protein
MSYFFLKSKTIHSFLVFGRSAGGRPVFRGFFQ